MPPVADWSVLSAPSLADFEQLAERALQALPQPFRILCEGMVIKIEDFPDDETLEAMACETEFDLLGLFRGRGMAQGPATPHTGELPNMVWLYRRPILDFWAGQDEALGRIVSHVLIHEIGHHFGLSDADMARIEAQAG